MTNYCRKCNDLLIGGGNWYNSFTKSGNYICIPCNTKRVNQYYIDNPDKKAEQGTAHKNRRNEIKKDIFIHYGGKCECCGIDNFSYLSVDHINNDGAKHRRELNLPAGSAFYGWIVKNNYPDGLRILCFNCNCSLGLNGYCPHQQKQIIDTKMKFYNESGTHVICRSCGIQLNDNNWYESRKREHKNICKKCVNLDNRSQVIKLKSKVISAYGGACARCNESIIEFLAIDHIHDNGKEEREKVGFGRDFYKYLLDNKFPQNGYQVLCYNCNSHKEYVIRRGGT
jgi:Fe-S cluster biogenesis protein NfuA